MDNKIEVVSMKREHLSEVLRIERATFSEPWGEKDFLEAIEDENKVYFVAIKKDEVVGYIGYWAVLDEAQIFNVAVKETERGQGIGSLLLKALIRHGRENEKNSFLLEVRLSNHAAIKLYKSFGFLEDGIRPKFYSKPTEDALLMSLRI